MNAEIIGIVRFSVLTRSGLASWRTTRETGLDEAAARIFAEERLALRLALFRLTTLAGFRREWDDGARFRLVVLVSPLMPAHWRAALEDDVRDAPFVHLVDVPFESNVGVAVKRFVRDLALGDATVLTFRIDDDDCLRTGAVAAMAGYAVREREGHVVSFVNGVYCGVADERLAVADRDYRSIALGLCFVSNAADFRSIFSLGAHTRLEESWPFVADPRPRAWLRSMHGAADTAGLHRLGDAVATGRDAEAILADAFPYLDAPALRDAYLRAAPVAA